MKPEELNKLLSRFSGMEVSRKTIAGNTIELWIECEPRSADAQNLWIDPPWRIEYLDEIKSSSADFPWEQEDDETKEEYRERFESARKQSDCIEKVKIESILFNPGTADITIKFQNNYILRSFTTWREESSWHYTNRKESMRYYVSAGKIEAESIS